VFDFTIQASAILMKLIQKTSNLLCKYVFLLLFFLFFLKQWYVQFLHTWICRKHLMVLSLLEVHPLQDGDPLEHLWDTQNLLS